MPIKRVTASLFALAFSCSSAFFVSANSPQRPNVIMIMADDIGWGDVGYSQKYSPTDTAATDFDGHPVVATPNLSAMADAGMKFNRFYAQAPVCSPSRSSFLTGRHYRRTMIDTANNGKMLNRELTIAEAAKTQGYATGHFGKWHLGTLTKAMEDGNRAAADNHTDYSAPWNNGYDTVFSYESATQTYNPYGRRENVGTPEERPTSLMWTGKGSFIADNPIGTSTDGNQVDPRLNGDKSRILVDEALNFITDSANNNQPFLSTVWLQAGHLGFTSDPNDTEFDSFPEQRDDYYTNLRDMDTQIGRIRQLVQTLGIADNTIIMFTSDNGPEGEGRPDALSPESFGTDDRPGSAGGLRGNKRDLDEGGIRVPGLIEWQGRVAAGSETDALGVATDYKATLFDIWGIGDHGPAQDGESLLPILTGEAAQRQGDIWFHHDRNTSATDRAYYDAAGQYKAMSRDKGVTWELYDLVADPFEQTDLSGDAGPNDAILADLVSKWNTRNGEVENQRANVAEFGGADFNLGYDDYIVAVTDGILNADNPGGFKLGKREADQPIIFLEQQFATLDTDIYVDSDGTPATYDVANPPTAASVLIEEGTVVHSYLVHFDSDAGQKTRTAIIEFEDPIIGLMSDPNTLVNTDFLAFADPKFETATSGAGRGMLESGQDAYTISPDGKTLTVTMRSNSANLDDLRVLTLSSLQFEDIGLPGDFNDDGTVDGLDFLAWQRGESPDPLSNWDLSDWQLNYGKSTSLEIATATVPEPGTLVTSLLGMLMAMVGKRRRPTDIVWKTQNPLAFIDNFGTGT